MAAPLRQFIEVGNHKALVSVKLLDQHRVVPELVGPKFKRGQKTIVDTTRIDQNKWSPLLVHSE